MAITQISGSVGPPPGTTGRTPARQDARPELPSAPPEAAQLQQATEMINHAMQSMSLGLEFSVDRSTNQTVVRVVDQETDEVILQIPSEEAMDIARALDRIQGLLLQQKA